MAERSTREIFAEQAAIHAGPPSAFSAHEMNRTFELPIVLYAAAVVLFLGFLASIVLTFGNHALIIPMSIFTLFIVMGFGVPTLWASMHPDMKSKAKSRDRSRRERAMTPFGLEFTNSDGDAAAVRVPILPALIFLWGIAIVVIAALVR